MNKKVKKYYNFITKLMKNNFINIKIHPSILHPSFLDQDRWIVLLSISCLRSVAKVDVAEMKL